MLECMKFFISILMSLITWLFMVQIFENVSLGMFILGIIFIAVVIRLFMKGRGN